MSQAMKEFWDRVVTGGANIKIPSPLPVADFGPREYQFVLLDSTAVFPPIYDVGIEVSLIHLRQSHAKMLANPLLIEQAVNLILPPNGSTIAIFDEYDTGAIGAAAIIYNRGRQQPNKLRIINILAAGGQYDHVAAIPNNWQRQLYRAISVKMADPQFSLMEKIVWLAHVLVEGRVQEQEFRSLLKTRDRMFAKAQQESTVWLTEDKRICVVESQHRFATKIGYQHANIVIAVNDKYPLDPRDPAKGTYLKYTICRFNPYVAVDLQGVQNTLNELEKGRSLDERTWGGRSDIIGSPHGRSSTATIDEVVDIVTAHLFNYE